MQRLPTCRQAPGDVLAAALPGSRQVRSQPVLEGVEVASEDADGLREAWARLAYHSRLARGVHRPVADREVRGAHLLSHRESRVRIGVAGLPVTDKPRDHLMRS